MASKTEILFSLILFYAILTTIIGFVGADLNNSDLEYTTDNDKNFLEFAFDGVITGFTVMGPLFNTVFFGSLGLLITWILVTTFTPLIPGSD